jgi:hypothetical protein
MPSVVVEVAFDSGYTTPAASRTWTDVTDYVELAQGLDISFGRQDERSTADANTLNLTLDNSDGRFTAGRVASPYYPNVKIGRPIRVKATPPGGSTVTRFVGYIDEWPVEWDGSDAYAYATISASSRLSRLGLNRPLSNIVSEEVLSDGPVGYWTLGDPSGSTSAQNSSGDAQVGPLVMTGSGTAVVFGNATGPGTDGLTAAQFANGRYLQGAVSVPVADEWTIEAFINTEEGGHRVLALGSNPGAADLMVTTGGVPTWYTYVTGTTAVNDGATHHIAVVNGGAGVGLTLYVDGVAEDDTAASPTLPASAALSVGGPSGPPELPFVAFTGTIAHVAFTPTALTAARIADHADAGLTGWAGVLPGDRIERYARYAGIPDPSPEVLADAGTTPIAHIDTTGMTAVEAMRKVETAEGGVLFDSPGGVLVFRGRDYRYTATPEFTLNAALQEVEIGYAPKLDRSALVNDATATIPGGSSFRAVNTVSVDDDDYGVHAQTVEIATTDDVEAEGAAWWLVNTYGEPAPRVPALTVDLLTFSVARQATILNLPAGVGSLLAVVNLPTQASVSSVSYFIEGWTERIGPESYFITFNLSPSSPALDVFILGDPVRGKLDSGMVLGW